MSQQLAKCGMDVRPKWNTGDSSLCWEEGKAQHRELSPVLEGTVPSVGPPCVGAIFCDAVMCD